MHFCLIARRGLSLGPVALHIRVDFDFSLVSVGSGEAKSGELGNNAKRDTSAASLSFLINGKLTR